MVAVAVALMIVVVYIMTVAMIDYIQAHRDIRKVFKKVSRLLETFSSAITSYDVGFLAFFFGRRRAAPHA